MSTKYKINLPDENIEEVSAEYLKSEMEEAGFNVFCMEKSQFEAEMPIDGGFEKIIIPSTSFLIEVEDSEETKAVLSFFVETYTLYIEGVIDLAQYAADIIEIGYEQQDCGGETDFDDALHIFCERQIKPATLIKVERAEKQFNAEFKGEGETFAFDV